MNLRNILRSPLLHFFLLGGLAFVLYDALNPAPSHVPRPNALVLTESDARRLAQSFTASRNRPPTVEELTALMRDWSIEEVMVREARALGLDRGDAVVRDRLRTKLEFIADAPMMAAEPDDAELSRFYDENAADFTLAREISFEQVLLPEDAPQSEIEALRAELEAGADPAKMIIGQVLPPKIENVPLSAVGRIFGAGFDDAIANLPLDSWAGPIPSGYGQHLVRIETLGEPAVPPLDSVRDRVVAAWRIAQLARLRNDFARALLERYTIEFPDPAAVLGQ